MTHPENTHPLDRHDTNDNEEETEYDCKKHELNYQTGYDSCPRCTQEQNLEAQRRHEATRNPQVEPW